MCDCQASVRSGAFRLSVRVACCCLPLVGCGPRSALDPAGAGAERIAVLAWWLFGGAALIWLVVMGIALYARRVRRSRHEAASARLLIVGGGVLFPALVLTVTLGYGLSLMPRLNAPAPPGGVSILVSGERWWWRVRYRLPSGDEFELANELHLPLGERVEVELVSPDVIHSFWVPALAGKMDMIPGRRNRLVLEPTRTGAFRGVCAEYCGTAHANMGFVVVVRDRASFNTWLHAERKPAARPTGELAEQGRALFMANGCGACHTVRGTGADGVIGPDLTHVGSRRTLAAGMLPNDPRALARWIGHSRSLKPGVNMPAFGMLSKGDLAALAAYLAGLQ
jgi:cytochrome c oxidase subunit 2